MTRTSRRLLLAFILSLAIHALPFVPVLTSPSRTAEPPPRLNVQIKPPPPLPPLLAAPEPILPSPVVTPTKSSASHLSQAERKARAPVRWQQAVQQQMQKLKASGRYYSREAIELGLEGNLVVLMVLDEAGNVTAARIEESSGHPILDRDARQAVLSLRYLPADAPREVLLPLRYRLRD